MSDIFDGNKAVFVRLFEPLIVDRLQYRRLINKVINFSIANDSFVVIIVFYNRKRRCKYLFKVTFVKEDGEFKPSYDDLFYMFCCTNSEILKFKYFFVNKIQNQNKEKLNEDFKEDNKE